MRPGFNAGEATQTSRNGLLIREDFPGLILTIQKGHAALTSSERELLKRIPYGFANDSELHAIADLSRRLGTALRVTGPRQIQLRDSLVF